MEKEYVRATYHVRRVNINDVAYNVDTYIRVGSRNINQNTFRQEECRQTDAKILYKKHGIDSLLKNLERKLTKTKN